MMFAAAAAAIIVAMALALARAFGGPTMYDRVLAWNSFGTKTVLLIGLIGFITGRPDFLDISLLYALLNFVATIAILKFFRYGTMSGSMSDERDEAMMTWRLRMATRPDEATPPADGGGAK